MRGRRTVGPGPVVLERPWSRTDVANQCKDSEDMSFLSLTVPVVLPTSCKDFAGTGMTKAAQSLMSLRHMCKGVSNVYCRIVCDLILYLQV